MSKDCKNSLEYKAFIRACYLRDGYSCRKCRVYKSDAKLNVHHIKNFAQYPKIRTIPVNGITICLKHHREFHNRYGRKDNTVAQIKEYLMPDESRKETSEVVVGFVGTKK